MTENVPIPNAAGPPARGQPQLSLREREIVALVAQGFNDDEVAGLLVTSVRTVKSRLRSIFEKLDISDRLELALYAIHTNIRTPM